MLCGKTSGSFLGPDWWHLTGSALAANLCMVPTRFCQFNSYVDTEDRQTFFAGLLQLGG